MKKILTVAAMLLTLCGVWARAASVSAIGGKKSVARMNDSSGYQVSFNDDKPWKVFESTGVNPVQVVDEAGVAPTQGMIRQVCLSSAATTSSVFIYDSSSTASSTGNLGPGVVGKRLAPPIVGLAATEHCVQLNALFTSGLFIEVYPSALVAPGGAYVYWRELGGYR